MGFRAQGEAQAAPNAVRLRKGCNAAMGAKSAVMFRYSGWETGSQADF